MIRVRQVELNALIFTQYDNGISEIKYHESSERAVTGFFTILDMIIRETPSHKTIYLLSDLSQTGHMPLSSHYAQIAKLNSTYDPADRPNARFANLYQEVSVKRKLVLAYMRSLEMPSVELEMFPVDQRNRAISWLLRDS